jgi:predicted RNA-binding Zn-ribbon protein involved in translation (DUF1610 family)
MENGEASPEIVRPLVDLRDRTIQKNRIAFEQRLIAIDQGRDTADPFTIDMLERYRDRFIELEKEIDDDIDRVAGNIPIVQKMIEVRGIGVMLAAKVVAMIDIERAQHVSSLWRFAGMAVTPVCIECGQYLTNGATQCPDCGGGIVHKADRPRKGQRLNYNARLKTYCWQVGTSLLRAKSPYRSIYDKARKYYDANREDWPKARKHRAAMRKMVKLFLQHLWVEWRELEGLPVTKPYSHEKQGHNSYLKPAEFGWPAKEE